jgi:uncharacterized protein (DUF433 family)
MEMLLATPQNEKKTAGIGLYSLSDAARYVGRSASVVSKWVNGRPVRSEKIKNQGSRTSSIFVTPPLEIDGEKVLTFEHLIELRMVDLFRDNNVSVYTIKAAAKNLALVLNTPHPFSSYDLKTDGKRIFAGFTPKSLKEGMTVDDGEIDEKTIAVDLQYMQIVMGPIVEMFLLDTDYSQGFASRWWLLGSENRAILDPKKNFGQPTDEPTGVPLSPLFALIKSGETKQSVSKWYDVPIEAVETAINLYNKIS